MDKISQNLEQKWQKNPINHQKGAELCNKGADQETVKRVSLFSKVYIFIKFHISHLKI